MHALASRSHVEVTLSLSDQVSISLEVELLLDVILDSSKGTLTDALATLGLRLGDLLLHTVRIVVVDLLEATLDKKMRLERCDKDLNV